MMIGATASDPRLLYGAVSSSNRPSLYSRPRSRAEPRLDDEEEDGRLRSSSWQKKPLTLARLQLQAQVRALRKREKAAASPRPQRPPAPTTNAAPAASRPLVQPPSSAPQLRRQLPRSRPPLLQSQSSAAATGSRSMRASAMPARTAVTTIQSPIAAAEPSRRLPHPRPPPPPPSTPSHVSDAEASPLLSSDEEEQLHSVQLMAQKRLQERSQRRRRQKRKEEESLARLLGEEFARGREEQRQRWEEERLQREREDRARDAQMRAMAAEVEQLRRSSADATQQPLRRKSTPLPSRTDEEGQSSAKRAKQLWSSRPSSPRPHTAATAEELKPPSGGVVRSEGELLWLLFNHA